MTASPKSSHSRVLHTLSLSLAAGIGLFAFFLSRFPSFTVLDPLVLALILGIALRTLVGRRFDLSGGSLLARRILIPLGIGFYALAHLDFAILGKVETGVIVLLFSVMSAFLLMIVLLGRWLGQKREITFLVATGSAICGASAIAITAPAVNADQDDVSVSLLAVTIAAMLSLLVINPLLGVVFGLSGTTYALMSGTTLQFTGFVKEAVLRMPHLGGADAIPLLTVFALNIKAVRYLGLLVAIPLFASLARRSLCFPRSLWLFIGAGVVGTWLRLHHPGLYQEFFTPWVGPLYLLFWSSAMAAIGLSADIRELLSDNGFRALLLAMAGVVAALLCFFFGILCLHLDWTIA